jgi:hypothetical protein
MTITYSSNFQFLGPQKFTQIGIFGSKTNHLATLQWNLSSDCLEKLLIFALLQAEATNRNLLTLLQFKLNGEDAHQRESLLLGKKALREQGDLRSLRKKLPKVWPSTFFAKINIFLTVGEKSSQNAGYFSNFQNTCPK